MGKRSGTNRKDPHERAGHPTHIACAAFALCLACAMAAGCTVAEDNAELAEEPSIEVVGVAADATAAVDESAAGVRYYPRGNEREYVFDGGRLFYETRHDEAIVTWVEADADDLYLPAEVDGHPVVSVQKISGRAQNIYYPNSVEVIDRSIGPVQGVRCLIFGYGAGSCALERISAGLDDGTSLERIVFGEGADDLGWYCMEFGDPEKYPKLAEVVNPPHRWSDGIEGHERLLEMLSSADAGAYVSPQSEKVNELAAQITSGAADDAEKVYLISEWVCDHIAYDYFEYVGEETDGYGNAFEREQEPEQVIDNRVAVCEGYAKLTRALCNAVGIPAVYISGITQGDRHAWNAICVDGVWGIYDNTESDSDWNADLSFRTPESLEDGISYEQYLANEELRQDYTWEEVQEQNAREAGRPFAEHHPFFDVSPVHIGANQIPESVDGVDIG